jgi:hypothetical protein
MLRSYISRGDLPDDTFFFFAQLRPLGTPASRRLADVGNEKNQECGDQRGSWGITLLTVKHGRREAQCRMVFQFCLKRGERRVAAN